MRMGNGPSLGRVDLLGVPTVCASPAPSPNRVLGRTLRSVMVAMFATCGGTSGLRTARGSATLPANPAPLGLRPIASVLLPIICRQPPE